MPTETQRAPTVLMIRIHNLLPCFHTSFDRFISSAAGQQSNLNLNRVSVAKPSVDVLAGRRRYMELFSHLTYECVFVADGRRTWLCLGAGVGVLSTVIKGGPSNVATPAPVQRNQTLPGGSRDHFLCSRASSDSIVGSKSGPYFTEGTRGSRCGECILGIQ